MIIDTYIKKELQDLIGEKINSIAQEYNVKILYACESGSRAWGFPSPDSDYDIRLIYYHPLEWYLSIDEGRDVIEKPIEKHPLGEIDLGGWDIRKVMRQIKKSNPVIWEWLQSPIVYQKENSIITEVLRNGIDDMFSPIKACYHYISICKGMMNNELQGEYVKIKKYFYMLRPILSAMWILRFKTIPPMEFQPLVSLLDDNKEMKENIAALLSKKQETDERIPILRMKPIDTFLEKQMQYCMEKAITLPKNKMKNDDLDQLFRSLIGFDKKENCI